MSNALKYYKRAGEVRLKPSHIQEGLVASTEATVLGEEPVFAGNFHPINCVDYIFISGPQPPSFNLESNGAAVLLFGSNNQKVALAPFFVPPDYSGTPLSLNFVLLFSHSGSDGVVLLDIYQNGQEIATGQSYTLSSQMGQDVYFSISLTLENVLPWPNQLQVNFEAIPELEGKVCIFGFYCTY